MFSSFVVGYLFLGGSGAGACVIAALLGLLVPRRNVTMSFATQGGQRTALYMHVPRPYASLISWSFSIACAALLLGVLFLVFDLGKVERIALLFILPNATFLTLGAYSLTFLIVVSLLLVVAWQSRSLRWPYWIVQALHVCALVGSIVVMVYTGLLLSDMPTVPFWHTVWIPILFVISALSCGCALVVGCACFTGAIEKFGTVFDRVARLDVVLLVLEALVLAALISVAFANPYEVSVAAAESLITGSYAALFIGGVLLVGVGAPIVLEVGASIVRARTTSLMLVVACAVLVGGVVLRYCIVSVGAHPEVWMVIS